MTTTPLPVTTPPTVDGTPWELLADVAERTRRVVAAVQEDGTCWCGATVWRGRPAMRVSVISWATTDADVDRSVEAILRIARSE